MSKNAFATARDSILRKRFGPSETDDDFSIPMAGDEYDYENAPTRITKEEKDESR